VAQKDAGGTVDDGCPKDEVPGSGLDKLISHPLVLRTVLEGYEVWICKEGDEVVFIKKNQKATSPLRPGSLVLWKEGRCKRVFDLIAYQNIKDPALIASALDLLDQKREHIEKCLLAPIK
jgi:hypothetical protein